MCRLSAHLRTTNGCREQQQTEATTNGGNKQTAATTSPAPGSLSTVTFGVTSSAAFTVGDIVYVTSAGTSTPNERIQGTIDSVPDAVSIVVAFSPAYTSTSTTGYQIDLYDPKTLYIITA